MALELRNVSFRHTGRSPLVLDGVSLSVEPGQRLGLVGPSGSGKTTLALLLAGYEQPLSGQILLDGAPLPTRGRMPVQLVCQHPETAINPRWKMSQVLEEGGACREEDLAALGIQPGWLNRYPRELSGGELQRFCLARALAGDSRYLIADEISAMLDPITQAQVWGHLLAQAEQRQLGLVVITHNPALAQRVCTQVVQLSDLQKGC